MNEQELKKAPKYAWKNIKAMEESETCGCFQCMEVMSAREVTEWTDYGKTALCPKCSWDCVIPQSSSIPIDEKTLEQINKYWLKG